MSKYRHWDNMDGMWNSENSDYKIDYSIISIEEDINEDIQRRSHDINRQCTALFGLDFELIRSYLVIWW